jgi:hypothetical protein
MSIVSGLSRIRTHKAHSFYYIQPTNPNDSIRRGLVLDLFSINEKKIGNIILNGYENYVGDKFIQQVTLSFFLDNNSLNFIIHFNTVRDAHGKTKFPPRIVTRDNNGRNLLIIINEKEREKEGEPDVSEPTKIEIMIQHI